MTSIFEQALGADFTRLHPALQQRFGFASEDSTACVGVGVMDRIWRGSAVTLPFLWLGTARHILFPETGTAVPFVIENYAYRDTCGRETVTFVRTFDVASNRRRRFDATMIYSPSRGRIVDFLGTHQHLAVDLELAACPDGSLRIRSGLQRFFGVGHGFRLPNGLSGVADLRESFDPARRRFTIDVRVTNPHIGPVFGYSGHFTVRYLDTRRALVPAAVKPLRENPRA